MREAPFSQPHLQPHTDRRPRSRHLRHPPIAANLQVDARGGELEAGPPSGCFTQLPHSPSHQASHRADLHTMGVAKRVAKGASNTACMMRSLLRSCRRSVARSPIYAMACLLRLKWKV